MSYNCIMQILIYALEPCGARRWYRPDLDAVLAASRSLIAAGPRSWGAEAEESMIAQCRVRAARP